MVLSHPCGFAVQFTSYTMQISSHNSFSTKTFLCMNVRHLGSNQSTHEVCRPSSHTTSSHYAGSMKPFSGSWRCPNSQLLITLRLTGKELLTGCTVTDAAVRLLLTLALCSTGAPSWTDLIGWANVYEHICTHFWHVNMAQWQPAQWQRPPVTGAALQPSRSPHGTAREITTWKQTQTLSSYSPVLCSAAAHKPTSDCAESLSERLSPCLTSCLQAQATEESKGQKVCTCSRSFMGWQGFSTWLNSQRNHVLGSTSEILLMRDKFYDHRWMWHPLV